MSINSLTHKDTINRRPAKCISESQSPSQKRAMDARRKSEDIKADMSQDEFDVIFKGIEA
jgi:Rps23 Pro-64 3,4-dihydroxylase Tpa1-like proline 4-hydroxylase